MKAFVRFQRLDGEPDRYVAWYRPDFRVLNRVAPFFARRFADMQWTIFTPEDSADWDGSKLRYGPGLQRSGSDLAAATAQDAADVQALWNTYYAATFNPARANPRLLAQHMPKRFWDGLPEASAIEDILREAPSRLRSMAGARASSLPSAADFLPRGDVTLPLLRDAVAHCRGCDICELGCPAVFGEGPADARLVLVGEQPGDEEDRTGRPFVGPAGRLLDEALVAAGIDRDRTYVTNAVKHFRFIVRGQRRMHDTPQWRHVQACRPWLETELRLIQPEAIVCLGAVAARALVGPDVRVTRDRGRVFSDTQWAPRVLVTEHPAAILRGLQTERAQRLSLLIADLRLSRAALPE
jgi:DNA polymerase